MSMTVGSVRTTAGFADLIRFRPFRIPAWWAMS